MIKFHCKNCGQKFSVPDIHAGKRDNMPLENKPEQTEPVPKRKLPWIIDIFLYPVNVSGTIHLAIFLFLPPLFWFLLNRFLLNRLSLNIFFMLFLCAGFFLLSLGYMFYYLAYCVLDSAKGGRRAPDISLQDVPDKGDLVSQVLLILGCVAICFWPAALYYVLTEKIDLTFWLLSACGTFFFPMALLAGVMFDSFNALNPILIVGSIFKTFLPYCGLLLFFYGLGGLVTIIITNLANLPKTQAIEGLFGLILRFLNCLFTVTLAYPGMAFIYLSMVASHLLGSFYQQHKKKLNWGI